MWACIKQAFTSNLPYNWDLWMLGMAIGCVVAGIASLIPGGPAGLAFLVGCLIMIGITLSAALLAALLQSIIDCWT